MSNTSWLPELFSAIDRCDTAAFVSFMTDDCTLMFGNVPPVAGKDNIFAMIDGFFQSIKGIRHTNLNFYSDGDNVFSRGHVTYTRHNGTEYDVDFCNYFQMEGDKIKTYQIYIDNHELYS